MGPDLPAFFMLFSFFFASLWFVSFPQDRTRVVPGT